MLKHEASFDNDETKDTILAINERTEIYIDSGFDPMIAEENAVFDICVDNLLLKQAFALESVIPTIAWLQ